MSYVSDFEDSQTGNLRSSKNNSNTNAESHQSTKQTTGDYPWFYGTEDHGKIPKFVELHSTRLVEFNPIDVKEIQFAHAPQNIAMHYDLFEKMLGFGLSLLNYRE